VNGDEFVLPPGGEPLGEFVWEPWTPQEAARLLAGVEAPWYVAAGWALDLFRGEQTREHEDLEVAVPRGSFGELAAALADYEVAVVGGPGDGSGRRWPLDDPAAEVFHQTWVRERGTNVYRLDVFREPHDGDTWICRRDETIRLPYARVVRRTAAGIPFLAPEIVLLFKAKHAGQAKNETDFAGAVPLLTADERAWLRDALGRVHPGHNWLERL
jgi:Aminoglycoside-2''-adenylyltransferase